jgi:hypothetical protein
MGARGTSGCQVQRRADDEEVCSVLRGAPIGEQSVPGGARQAAEVVVSKERPVDGLPARRELAVGTRRRTGIVVEEQNRVDELMMRRGVTLPVDDAERPAPPMPEQIARAWITMDASGGHREGTE